MSEYTIHHGSALEVLRGMESESVQCCITSPPYFGLRDYGVTGQIGLEPTPAEYVAALVAVFEEVRRVLKPDGTCWVNLGDSYTSLGRSERKESPGVGAKQSMRRIERTINWHGGAGSFKNPDVVSWTVPGFGFSDLKPKDIMGIPWRVAFALQDAGWWLRQDIIWSKPNPMPESVTDRCTKAHEYIFLLTKSAKYHFDSQAIAEPVAASQVGRVHSDIVGGNKGDEVHHSPGGTYKTSWNGSQFHTGETAIHQLERSSTNRDRSLPRNRNGITGSLDAFEGETRNKRSVWTVTTQPYSEAHFATFPPKLIEPMVLAGSREGDTVLDPFNGSGTTGLVSLRHRRRYVGIELNAEYIEISERRLKDVQVSLF